MTPEEILLELRDIHLPADTVGAAPSPPLAPEPFLLAFALLAIWIVIARRRATLWRRQGRARLAALKREPCEARAFEGMTDLAAVLARSARAGPAPAVAHLPPEKIGPGECAALRAHLAKALGDGD